MTAAIVKKSGELAGLGIPHRQLDGLLIVIAGLTFAFPRHVPTVVWLPFGVMWAISFVHHWAAPTARAAGFASLALAVAAAVAFAVSTDPNVSRGKFAGIVLDATIYWLITVYWDETHELEWTCSLAALIALSVAAVGLVGTAWFPSKIAHLQAVYQHLPHLLPGFQSSFGTTQPGIQPNELGGTLALLVPLCSALAVFAPSSRHRAAFGVVTLTAGLVAVLSQSRASLTGIALGLLLVLTLRLPRLRLAIVGSAVALAGVALGVGLGPIERAYLAIDQATGNSTLQRLDVWQRALHLIADYPYTGIGLNTFPQKTDLLYPVFSTGPQVFVPHAHDLYLQTALDLGVGGLVVFLSMVALSLLGLVRAWRTAPASRALAAGLAAGLVSFLTSELLDAVALGSKPSPLFFAILGLGVAVGDDLTGVIRRWAGVVGVVLFAAMIGIPVALGDGNPIQAWNINRLNLEIAGNLNEFRRDGPGIADFKRRAAAIRGTASTFGRQSGPFLYALGRTEQVAKFNADAEGDLASASNPRLFQSDSDPRLFEARAQDGLLLIGTGQFSAGIAAITSALTVQTPEVLPQDRARLDVVMGQTVWQRNHDLAGLEADFDAAVRLDSSVVWPYHQLITLALDRHDLTSAAHWVGRLESVAPTDTWTYFYVGRVAYEAGDRPAALHDFAEAIQADPNNEQPEFWAGVTDQTLGRWASAVGHFQRAIALDPKNSSYQQYLENSQAHASHNPRTPLNAGRACVILTLG